ncbi:exodeoxyribonuclease III [Jeotgalibaca caeni]|uniref:exodeoxyribonuclease III n=1 Tax=Jeotgalibaca caeni TaxID=3028623 RepID=UPI00237DE20D|nr:exodeoxyribonuclease III [Jeotgalibaca caeni]MDE1549024.1 exodeoxyribonuclease III [Jeotgalibaca caeni]
MKLVSWNVNGLRAIVKKNFLEVFQEFDADFFCLQETKLQEGQIDLVFPGYTSYWNYAERKGYSGTAIFAKQEPLSVRYGMGIDHHDQEGRVIALEYDQFWVVTVYTPNSKAELARIDYRMQWEDDFRIYLKELEKTKPVIVCGDLNVAHTEIDLKNPQSNRMSAGFSDQERTKFSTLLDHGFVDTFRFFYPDVTNKYTWWNYRFNARKNNAGWRIDYFLVSDALKDNLIAAEIHDDIMGSDHCPVSLEISVDE